MKSYCVLITHTRREEIENKSEEWRRATTDNGARRFKYMINAMRTETLIYRERTWKE